MHSRSDGLPLRHLGRRSHGRTPRAATDSYRRTYDRAEDAGVALGHGFVENLRRGTGGNDSVDGIPPP